MMRVRCFKRLRDDDGRPGMWLMRGDASSRDGVFFHGDRDEIQESYYTISFLEDNVAGRRDDFSCDEITADELVHTLRQHGAESLAKKAVEGLAEHGISVKLPSFVV